MTFDFESLKWKYSFATNSTLFMKLGSLLIREVSPPFGEDRASTAVKKAISSTERIV